MIQAVHVDTLRVQLDALARDRPVRLLICATCIVLMEILSANPVLLGAGVAGLLFDLFGARYEAKLRERRSFGIYLRVCAAQTLSNALLVLPFATRIDGNQPELAVTGLSVMLMLVANGLVVRSGKVLLLASTILPFALGIVLSVLALANMIDRLRAQSIVSLVAVLLFSYLVASIWSTMARQHAANRAQAKAVRAARDKERFFAAISHEIRTPLNGIVGMAQMLSSKSHTPVQSVRIRALLDSAEVLRTLMDDLLDHAKLGAGQFAIHLEPTDPRIVARQAMQIYSDAASRKGVTLRLKVLHDVPAFVRSDPIRLRQVLSNLVSNAVKHTPSGEIRMELRTIWRGDGCWLEFAVRDTGRGIAPDRLGTIFEPYQQLEDAAARDGTGTGLGLTIARDLIRAMGGDIRVKSDLGHGSAFFAAFPAPQTDGRPEIAPEICGQTIAGRRILVADDSRVNRLVARGFLEEQGAMVLEAGTGQSALDLLAAEPVDVVLMDMQMPVLDGIAAKDFIRSDPSKADLPVILLTAAEETERDGFDGVLRKPLDRDSLLHMIADLIIDKPPELRAI